jgi:hypothetical protein
MRTLKRRLDATYFVVAPMLLLLLFIVVSMKLLGQIDPSISPNDVEQLSRFISLQYANQFFAGLKFVARSGTT